MKAPQDIILKPLITERSSMEAANGRYTFVVARGATKPEIRQAAELLFDVKVLNVNTMNRIGKKRRVRYQTPGLTASWKKAVITIDTDPSQTDYLAKGGKTETTDRKYKTSIEEFGFGQ